MLLWASQGNIFRYLANTVHLSYLGRSIPPSERLAKIMGQLQNWLVWLEKMLAHSQKYKSLSASNLTPSNVPLPPHFKSNNNIKKFILTLTSGSFSHSSIYKS